MDPSYCKGRGPAPEALVPAMPDAPGVLLARQAAVMLAALLDGCLLYTSPFVFTLLLFVTAMFVIGRIQEPQVEER